MNSEVVLYNIDMLDFCSANSVRERACACLDPEVQH